MIAIERESIRRAFKGTQDPAQSSGIAAGAPDGALSGPTIAMEESMHTHNTAPSRRRRPFQRALAALAFGGILAALTPMVAAQDLPKPSEEAKLYDNAKKEGQLTWYISGQMEGMRGIADDFEKKYPGIKVNILKVVGVQQYQRFLDETNAKKNYVDILQMNDYPSMKALVKQGHIAEWKIPTYDRFHDDLRIGDSSYALYYSTLGILYNETKLKPEEVEMLRKDYRAILDPRFKGRFNLNANKCSVCYAPIFMFLDPKMNYGGWAFLEKILAQDPAVYADDTVGVDRVVAGENDFTLIGWEAIGTLKRTQGAPVRWVFPEPAPEYGNAWQSISKYAPHPNAARLFMNWVNSPEGSYSEQLKYGSKTTLAGVEDKRPVVKEAWYRPPTKTYSIDWERWGKDYLSDMGRWGKMVNASAR